VNWEALGQVVLGSAVGTGLVLLIAEKVLSDRLARRYEVFRRIGQTRQERLLGLSGLSTQLKDAAIAFAHWWPRRPDLDTMQPDEYESLVSEAGLTALQQQTLRKAQDKAAQLVLYEYDHRDKELNDMALSLGKYADEARVLVPAELCQLALCMRNRVVGYLSERAEYLDAWIGGTTSPRPDRQQLVNDLQKIHHDLTEAIRREMGR
jgi:hypothetical protein